MMNALQFGKGWGCIADSTLGGSAASVDFPSIIGTYAHLMAVVYARGDLAALNVSIQMRLNNDSAANYDYQSLRGIAASTNAQETFGSTAGAVIGNMPTATAGANLFGVTTVFLPHYAGSSNNKACVSLSSMKVGTSTGNLFSDLYGGFWRSAAAISRITLVPSVGNFVAGTRVSLYAMGA